MGSADKVVFIICMAIIWLDFSSLTAYHTLQVAVVVRIVGRARTVETRRTRNHTKLCHQAPANPTELCWNSYLTLDCHGMARYLSNSHEKSPLIKPNFAEGK